MPQRQQTPTIKRVLRDRENIWNQIAKDEGLRTLSTRMLTGSAIALALYGAVLGASSDWPQTVASAIKLPLLFLVTLAVCLPALYAFNLVFKAKLSLRQTLALVSVGITVIAMLSLALAPISLFFLLTAADYDVFKLLNVAILTLTGLVGLRVLINGMRAMNAADAAAAAEAARQQPEVTGVETTPTRVRYRVRIRRPQAISMGLVYTWVVVFGIVGTQLAWILRPFIGNPDEDFGVFRSMEGNFFADLARTLGNLF